MDILDYKGLSPADEIVVDFDESDSREEIGVKLLRVPVVVATAV